MKIMFALPTPGNTGGMRMLSQMYQDEGVYDRNDVVFFDTFFSWGTNKLTRFLQSIVLRFQFAATLVLKKVDAVFIMTSSNMGFYDKTLYALIARILGKKVVLNPVGGQFIDFYQRNSINRKLVPICLKIPNGIVAGTSYWFNYFKTEWPDLTIENIPNPVRLNIDADFKKNPSPQVITFLARIDEQKGANIFGKAIASLLQSRSDFEVQIAGDGPYRVKLLEDLTEGMNSNRVKYLGFVSEEEKKAALQRSHIYVLPTEFEVLPISILEAMAAANAVIATNVGGISDAVLDKINGILLSKPDYDELVAALNYLLDNPGLTNSMGVQGQRHVKQYELGLIVERQVAFCASFV